MPNLLRLKFLHTPLFQIRRKNQNYQLPKELDVSTKISDAPPIHDAKAGLKPAKLYWVQVKYRNGCSICCVLCDCVIAFVFSQAELPAQVGSQTWRYRGPGSTAAFANAINFFISFNSKQQMGISTSHIDYNTLRPYHHKINKLESDLAFLEQRLFQLESKIYATDLISIPFDSPKSVKNLTSPRSPYESPCSPRRFQGVFHHNHDDDEHRHLLQHHWINCVLFFLP